MTAVAVFGPKALVETIAVPGAQMSMQSLEVSEKTDGTCIWNCKWEEKRKEGRGE